MENILLCNRLDRFPCKCVDGCLAGFPYPLSFGNSGVFPAPSVHFFGSQSYKVLIKTMFLIGEFEVSVGYGALFKGGGAWGM